MYVFPKEHQFLMYSNDSTTLSLLSVYLANFLLYSNFTLHAFDNFNSLKQQLAFKIPKENYAKKKKKKKSMQTIHKVITQQIHRTVSLFSQKYSVYSEQFAKGHIPVQVKYNCIGEKLNRTCKSLKDKSLNPPYKFEDLQENQRWTSI